MKYNDDAKQLEYRVLSSVTRLSYDNQLSEHLRDILYEIILGPRPTFRCCTCCEHEIIRERVSVACGEDLPHREDKVVMGVFPAACKGCSTNHFNVTDNCRKYLAKKRVAACSFGTASVTGRDTYIGPTKYKKCGHCAVACPCSAISNTTRPCLRFCPVNVTTMDKYRLAAIDYSRCISYGAYMADCPFGAITDRPSMMSVVHKIQFDERVYAVFVSVIEGHFGAASVGQLKKGLHRFGFADAVEVSLGVDTTAYHEAQELKEVITEGRKMTIPRCPAFVDMIKKRFPKLEPDISYTASPMTLIVRYLKENEPDMKITFFGPYVAKKLEIQKAESIADYVTIFEELAAIFSAREIEVETFGVENVQDSSIKDKNFAASDGVTAAAEAALAEDGFDQSVPYVKCSGVKECERQLMVMNAGRMQEDLIEDMACEDGCVAGSDGVEPV